jgi:hypothetical protein
MTMQVFFRERTFERLWALRPTRLAGLAICLLLAAAAVTGVALGQSGRSARVTSVEQSAPAPLAAKPARPFERAIGDPSPFGYQVYDWEGPVPTFADF